MEVVQGKDRGSKTVRLCPSSTITFLHPSMWEEKAALSHGRYKYSANSDKAFIQCELVEDGTVYSIS